MNIQVVSTSTYSSLSPAEVRLIIEFRAIDGWFATLSTDQKKRLATMPEPHRNRLCRRAVSIYVTKGGR